MGFIFYIASITLCGVSITTPASNIKGKINIVSFSPFSFLSLIKQSTSKRSIWLLKISHHQTLQSRRWNQSGRVKFAVVWTARRANRKKKKNWLPNKVYVIQTCSTDEPESTCNPLRHLAIKVKDMQGIVFDVWGRKAVWGKHAIKDWRDLDW